MREATATLPLGRIKPRQPAADLVRSAFGAAVSRIRAADPEARRGDVEGVHHLRTATRRLRSELRAVSALVKPGWRDAFESELKWLADALGAVRDLDVLMCRLRDALSQLAGPRSQQAAEAPGEPLGPLFVMLQARHRERTRALRQALRSQRYHDLIARLESSMTHPDLTDRAARTCRKVLPPLAFRAWRKLRKHARKLHPHDPDEAFHKVRKLAKRARYTAELIAPALGASTQAEAERFIRLTTRLQDVLGEHQDATIARAELERFLAECPAGSVRRHDLRALIRAQQRAVDRARATFFQTWPRLDRRRSLRWLKAHAVAGV